MTDDNKEVPIRGMKIKPYGYPLMAEAWLGCLSWAIGQEEVKSAFKAETGYDLGYLVNASGLGRMINQSTGYEREVFVAWCDWVTETVWGTDEDGDKQ